jgi:hypothetical protein
MPFESMVLLHSWLFRIPALSIGVLFLYLALLLYPDERGKIQNRLIDLWIMFSHRGEASLGQTGKLISGASKVVNDLLNKLYGERLLSIRAFTASAALSVASATLVVGVLFRNFDLPEHWIFFALSMMASVAIVITTVFFAFARRFKPLYVSLGFPCFMLSLWYFLNVHGLEDPDPEKNAPRALWVIAAGVLRDVLFVALIRKMLRWTSQVTSVWKLAVGILTTLMAGAFLTGPAISVFINMDAFTDTGEPFRDELVLGYFLASSTNMVAAVISVLVIFVFAVALLNRFFWPFMARPIYMLVDLGVLNNRKLLGTIGCVLVAFAFPSITGWISKIKELPW